MTTKNKILIGALVVVAVLSLVVGCIFLGQKKAEEKTFDEAMENMNIFRIAVASSVDRLYLIKLEIGNIALELELFTNKKVRVF